MVNENLPASPVAADDRGLAVLYAGARDRPAFAALLALDARLAAIVRATREPLVGQMRLTWWHDALERLDQADAPAEPLLRALQADVLPRGLRGADLAALVEGWEVLLDPLDEAVIAAHGERRGARLFGLAGRIMGGDPALLAAAGEGWALADLAAHVSQPAIGGRANTLAGSALAQGFAKSWPASARALGALALFQMLRIEGKGAVQDFVRLTRFRLTGR